jgi:tetratricopeptide (TPR) repeat protein
MWKFLTASAALALTLGACASQPSPPPASGLVAKVAPQPKSDPEASGYGLFLAGQAALDQGKLDDASDYLARAAAAEGEPVYLRDAAFGAALAAGQIDRAAALAPAGQGVGAANRSLGVLVRGVEAMAEDRDKEAYAILSSPDVIVPYRSATALLAPWAAAGARDKAHATAEVGGGDTIVEFIGELDRAVIYERAGERDKAETDFKQLLAGGDPGGLVSAAYGAFLERRGRSKDAVAIYDAALARTPGDRQLLAVKARAERRGRAPPQPTVREGAAQVLVIGAASMLAQKQQEPALAYIRLSLRLNPSDDEAWVLLGDLLGERDVDGARDAYSHVKPASDQYVTARGKLAWTFEGAGDHDAALKLARETARAAPQNRDAAVTLADLLRTSERYDESAAVLTTLIGQSSPAPDWRLYYLRASAYEEAGDWPKAEADLQAALKLRPDEPELLNFLGYAWIDRGEHLKEAVDMVQRAVDANPQSGAMIDSLGWGYYRLGDYKIAVEKLEEAVSLEPADADVNNHLGDAYWRVGRKIEAGFQWRRVLTLEPDEKLKAQVAAKLASPLGPDAPLTPAGAKTAEAK